MKPLSIYKQPPLLFASLSKQLLHNDDRGIFKERRLIKYSSSFNSCCIVHALKEDSKQYEIDPEKAREALKELDQKIQSLSNREVSSPKLKVSEMKPTREEVISENNGKLEISESFLALLAGGLVLFTILYNVLFLTVIKPAIDGP
ncbi:transmembrane protein, putative [Medicago truncatula]|nr:transmembrane protein, putative [Medicago truncatula]